MIYLVSSPECTLTRMFFSSRCFWRREREVPRLRLRCRVVVGRGRARLAPALLRVSNSESEEVFEASSPFSEMPSEM